MKFWFSRFDRLRLLALTVWVLPLVALLPLGMLWLWPVSYTHLDVYKRQIGKWSPFRRAKALLK